MRNGICCLVLTSVAFVGVCWLWLMLACVSCLVLVALCWLMLACLGLFGLVCIMARWWFFSSALAITTFLIIVSIVNAERHHRDSIIQLLKDPEQLEIVHAMLKNYKG